MLILYYQRLFLFLLFYSGQSNHPLLAFYPSCIVSKPLHPQVLLLYTILFVVSRSISNIIFSYNTACYLLNLSDRAPYKIDVTTINHNNISEDLDIARMKDYYDVYFFLTKLKNDINLEIFKQALNNTLKKRESLDYYKDYRKILDGLINDERINNYWSTYKKKTKYAENIEFREIIGVLGEFLDHI